MIKKREKNILILFKRSFVLKTKKLYFDFLEERPCADSDRKWGELTKTASWSRGVKRFAPSKNRGSVALTMVLMIIAIITTLAIEISYRSQVSASLVVNKRDYIKAYELAKASFRWSLMRLSLDTALDQIPAIPGTNYGGKKDDLSEMQWAMPLPYPLPIGGSLLEKSPEQLSEELGGSFISNIYDETAKINLNDVGSGGPETQKTWSGTAEVLENLILSYRFKRFVKDQDHRELLWAIEDWVDDDSKVNHMSGGIEDAQYALDSIPNFHVKNGPFYTVDEVKLLKPMTSDMFEEIKPFITVYPFDAKLPKLSTQPVNPLGTININTAPLELIAALFNRQALPNLKARLECAQLVTQARELQAFRSVGKGDGGFIAFLNSQCGGAESQQEGQFPIVSNIVQKILAVRSDYFRIEAQGTVGKITTTIDAVVSRKDSKKPQIMYWRVR